MAWHSILTAQPISTIRGNSHYRNAAREAVAGGSPVFFNPQNLPTGSSGFGGPRYEYGYTYDNSPQTTYNGNCTWWCYGRLEDTIGTSLTEVVARDAKYWYGLYSGNKDPNANNIQAGDIIVLTDSGAGHVMFVEKVDGDTVHVSQSAYSSRAVWNGYACHVSQYSKSEIVAGNNLNMYKGYDTPYSLPVVGVIHTGEDGPGPEPPEPEDNSLIVALSGTIINRRKRKNVKIIL